jgi:hypothetical protein
VSDRVRHQGRANADCVLLAALAAGQTVEVAAVKAGVSSKTVHRRLNNPAFLTQLQAARSEMVRRMVGRLTTASAKAISALQGLLKASNEHVRLGAAVKIIELGGRLRDSADLAERVAALERQVKGQDNGNGNDSSPGTAGGEPGDADPTADDDCEPVADSPAPGPRSGDDSGGDDSGLLADDVAPLSG